MSSEAKEAAPVVPPWVWLAHPDNLKIARGVARAHGDLDLESVALEGMWRAMDRFDRSRGAWHPYADRAAVWAVRMYLRADRSGRSDAAPLPGRDGALAYLIAERFLALLEPKQAEALRRRHGLEPYGEPSTWAQVGKAMRLPRSTAYDLAKGGMDHLRALTTARSSA